MPKDFLDKMKSLLKEEFDDFLRSYGDGLEIKKALRAVCSQDPSKKNRCIA